MKDFYYILGTDNKATRAELDAAYRKLAQKLGSGEPDHHIQSHFRDITEAYEILSDPVRRRRYDIALKKNQQKRLYYFKIRHINIAATLALVIFTLLFGWYVSKMINGSKTKKTVMAVLPAAAVYKPKHHKKKHLTPNKVESTTPIIAQAVIKPLPKRIDTPAPQPVIKPAPVVIVHQQPVAQPSQGYTAYIRSNETGVVNLHQLASYTSAVLISIPNHAQIRVMEKGSSFYKVTFKEQTGYVPKWTIAAQ